MDFYIKNTNEDEFYQLYEASWAYGPNIVWGHSISLPDRFAYTVHIYNFVWDFIRACFKDFSRGGGVFFEKGPLVGDSHVADMNS
jgi:hypothetical protein